MKSQYTLIIFILLPFFIDAQVQWNILDSNPPNPISAEVKKYNGNFFTTTSDLAFRSSDGLKWEIMPILNDRVLSFAPRFFTNGDQHLFLAGPEALYRADDTMGENFIEVLNYPVHELVVKNNSTVLAYTRGFDAKFHISFDGGNTWTTEDTDFESLRGLIVYKDHFWMRSFKAVHKIQDDLTITSNNIPDDVSGNHIIEYQNKLLINNTNSWDDAPGLHVSNDDGLTWQEVPTPQDAYIGAMAVSGDKLYIAIGFDGTNSTDAGVYVSEGPFSGMNWEKLEIDLKHYAEVSYFISVFENEIFINYGEQELMKSNNGGASWLNAVTGLIGASTSTTDFWTFDNTWFFKDDYIYYSTDLGQNWAPYFSNLTDSIGGPFDNYFRVDSSIILAHFNIGSWRSDDNGESWMSLGAGGGRKYFLSDSSRVYSISAAAFGGKLERSDDLGLIWATLRALKDSEDFWCNGDTLLVSQEENVIRSTDGGETWTEVYTGPNSTSFWYNQNIEEFGDLLFLAKNGLHVSEDWGETWTPRPNNLVGFEDIKEIHKMDNFLLAVSEEAIFLSSDTATTWIDISLNLLDAPLLNESISHATVSYPHFIVSKYSGNLGVLNITEFECFGSSNASDCLTLSGNIFEEENTNCEKDSTEIDISNAILKITPGPYYTATDTNGYYNIRLAKGNHSVNINASGYESEAVCPENFEDYTNFDLDSNLVLNFGLIPLDTNDMEIRLHAGIARFGRVMPLHVQLNNLGLQESSGEVILDFDHLKLDFIDTLNNEFVLIDESKLSLSYNNLMPQNGLKSNLYFRVKGMLGDPACISASVFPDIEDDFPDNNERQLCKTIVSSFDPNDKLVLPNGEIFKDQRELEYTIRFQNTGNDTAFFVRLVDTLISPLDPFTIRTISSSHPYSFALKGSGIAEWTFSDILLPDSTTNNVESQGFVQFEILLQNDLAIGQVIENNAAIYFDFNAPVITNTTENFVVDFPVNTTKPKLQVNSLEVYPNPADEYFLINFPKYIDNGDLKIYNLNGQIIEERSIRNQYFSKVNSSHYPKGLYFIEFTNSDSYALRTKIILR